MKKIGYIFLLLVGLFIAWTILSTTRVHTPEDAVLIFPEGGAENTNGWEIYRINSLGYTNRNQLFYREIPILNGALYRCEYDKSSWCISFNGQTLLDDLDSLPAKQTNPVIPFYLAGLLARYYAVFAEFGNVDLNLEGRFGLDWSNASQDDISRNYTPAWEFKNDEGQIRMIDAADGSLIYIEPWLVE